MTLHVLLLVENNSYPFDVRVRRESLALRDAGCRVTVIAPRSALQPWVEDVDGVTVRRFPAPAGGSGLLSYAFEFVYSTLAMLALALWVRLFARVHVVHAANPPDTLFVVGIAMKLLGARFIFDHHDLSPETYLSRFGKSNANAVSAALRLLERASFACADVVIATNESYKRLAIQRGRKTADKVFVVRNGPPLSFQPVAVDAELRRRSSHLIGYIGTMGRQDGVDYLLRAVKHLVTTEKRRDFLAVIIGGGDEAGALKELAATLQIEEFVEFTGRVPDARVRTLLSSVDVCVQPDPLNPLNDKSTMNKMMEYMALCKPIVAFDLVETRFSGGDAAVYVPPNDEQEFARQISRLFDDPERCRQLGVAGQTRVSTALAWEYSVPSLLAAYRGGLALDIRFNESPPTLPVRAD
jgi:glycosyltransferase involved in cell wall biosynthesis